MKTICGMSLRGCAYFCSSVHICIGVLFFAMLIDRLVYQVYYRNLNVEALRVDKESVIYFGLFLPLGILIFKAIDKENKTLLKWASAVLLALQLFGIIIRMKYGYLYSTSLIAKSRNPYAGPKLDSEISVFKLLSMEIMLFIAYLITLYFYARQLESFPGRIYGQSSIPLYSTNSTYFVPGAGTAGGDHRNSHHHRMTTPFSYNFEPPPPYSSVNNLNSSSDGGGVQGQAQFQLHHFPSQHNQQQPCTSRTMFANISRNISFIKKSSNNQNHHLHNNNLSSLNVTIPNSTNISTNPNNLTESDSPSAPLLENHHHQMNETSSHTSGGGIDSGGGLRNNNISSSGKDIV